MTAQAGPLFRYSRIGFSFEVHPNRIDVSEKGGFGGIFGGKKHSILARTISGVDVTSGLAKKLKISTTDGKAVEYQLGGKNDEAREAILSIL